MKEIIRLSPAMELKTTVSMLKTIPEGTAVSYGRTYKSKGVAAVATVPIGYADGYPRSMSNRAEMIVCGKRAKVIGRVCMDQSLLDVTGIDGVDENSVVTVIGRTAARWFRWTDIRAVRHHKLRDCMPYRQAGAAHLPQRRKTNRAVELYQNAGGIAVKRQFAFVLALLAALAVLGGKAEKREETSDETPSTIGTAPPLLDIEVDKLITVEQVSEVLGFVVRPPHLADENTTARYYSEDSLSYLEISVQEATRGMFDETVSLYEDAADVDDIGLAAIWSAEQMQLLIFNGEYMISITVLSRIKTTRICLRTRAQSPG